MQRLHNTAGLAILQLLSALALSCADEVPKAAKRADAVEDEEAQPASMRHAHPSPELRLIEYKGSLCPEETVEFHSNPGVATLVTSTDQSTGQECRILLELTVPAGYRFRRPVVFVSGWALKEDESTSAARVTMRYSMAGTTLSSEHIVPGLPFSASGSMSFLLTDTPDLQVPECEDSAQSSTLEFEVVVAVEIPDDHLLLITALDWNFVDRVRWRRCDEDL